MVSRWFCSKRTTSRNHLEVEVVVVVVLLEILEVVVVVDLVEIQAEGGQK